MKQQKDRISSIMHRAFWLSLLFSIGVAGLIYCYSGELGYLFYKSRQAAYYIRLLAPLIPVMYIDSATDAMLKGLGEQVYSMKINIVDASLSVLLVWILLPIFGIYGYVITIYVTELLNAALSIVRLLNVGHLRPRILSWIFAPLFCIVLSTVTTRFVLDQILKIPDKGLLGLLIKISVNCLLYLLLERISGALKKKDVQWLVSFVRIK